MVKTDYIEIAAIRDECAQQLLIDLVFVLLCFFSLPFFFVVVCPYFAWDNRITDVRPVFTAGEDQEKKKEAIDVFFKNSVEPLFKSLEKQLEDNGTDYIIGNQVIITIRVCLLPCVVHGSLSVYRRVQIFIIDRYQYIKRVSYNVSFISYIASRP